MLSSKKGGAKLSRSPTLAGFLAQLDELAATGETHTDDRNTCAVAVRKVVKLARQHASMHTTDTAGLCWRP